MPDPYIYADRTKLTSDSLVAYGFQRLEGKWSYQGIIVFQFLVVALLLIAYPSFPESPYYLLTKDQPIKARKALEQIHGRGDQALIDAEMARISGSMRSSAALATAAGASGHPMVQCFKGTNLVRESVVEELVVANHVLLETNHHLHLASRWAAAYRRGVRVR